MSHPMPYRLGAVLCTAAALLLVSAPTLAGAGAPEARTTAKCGAVKTRNGGKARYVNTVRARCRTGRRVARKANGRRYSALGFDCRPQKKRNLRGKLYGCGRFKDGRGQGVGFIYTRP